MTKTRMRVVIGKGLRQGDPLSPFLFNLVAGGLNVLLHRALSCGLIKGAVIGQGDSLSTISHLQFANDTIIFCEAVWEEVLTVKRILRCFQPVSGLKINFSKSLVSDIGVPDQLVEEFANRLHCKRDEVSRSKAHGGLGIRKIQNVNDCLLAKWWWRFGVEDNALWKRVICSRYRPICGRWLLDFNATANCSVVWGGILRISQSNPNLVNSFLENIQIVVGDGARDLSLKLLIERNACCNGWNLTFRRALFAWEAEDLERLYLLLNRSQD
ncbi:uncharacterized protein LOC114309229 [Camellia sinensis]|uniref:uncharacterized protein LOC114309229 n=1 Tax=Camellia sinensis TaxID=4442 RepID=UPI0010362597|nr:uncharacterized protein LOC114309229 [Camellia sinensis]